MATAIDLIGQKFGRLTVLGRGANKGAKVKWICQCECGRVTASGSSDLRLGKSTACRICSNVKHGSTRHGVGAVTREYRTWLTMNQRCRNPNATGFSHYGGRGITICERWADFRNFLADMGPRPEGTSLDRIDNDGNYEPGNCRWATRHEQNLNKRHNPTAWQKHDRDPVTGRFVN